MVQLKDGSEVSDARLDRLVHFDDRSRNYPVRIGEHDFRSYTWRIKYPWVLDQGNEGACVGYAVTNELQARPSEVNFGGTQQADAFARNTYYEAQKIDWWPGGAYPGATPYYEGTSVLAGMHSAMLMGYFEQYRWAFGIDDLVHGLGRNGPAVIGMWWWDSMYYPDENHYIRPEGSKVGGHAILARAVKVVRDGSWVDYRKSYITLRNSWGPEYGKGGDCYISFHDMAQVLEEDGEAVFAIGRTRSID